MDEIRKAIQALEDMRDVGANRLKNETQNQSDRKAVYIGYDDLSAFNWAIDALREKERLSELAKAEREGRTLIVPEGVDGIAYVIDDWNCETQDCPRMDDNGDCDNICPKGVYEVSLHKCSVEDVLGMTLYATREEAEAALAERQAAASEEESKPQ